MYIYDIYTHTHIYISYLAKTVVYCVKNGQEYERTSLQLFFIARVMDDAFLLYNSFYNEILLFF